MAQARQTVMKSYRWVAATALACVLGGCAATPGSSLATAPASSGAATQAILGPSTSAPTEAASTPLPPDPIMLGSAVRVAVSELNLREQPSAGASKVVVLTPENVLALFEGPVEADGYTWYRGRVVSATGNLAPLPDPLAPDGEPAFGWLAVAKGGTQYVTRMEPRCPTTVDLVNVAAQLPAERLACFGAMQIVLEGTYGCSGCGGSRPGTYEPKWLAFPMNSFPLSVSADDGRSLALRLRPDGPPPPDAGSIARVTGHFDDPAAQTCRMSVPPSDDASPVPIDPAIAILICRQEFVVETFEVVGTDPAFGGA
jgi:hypothetical protein